jgi:heat shock protein HslJ
VAALVLGFVCTGCTQNPPQSAAQDLGGTSWHLVKFQGADDKTLAPADKARYTLAFDKNGSVSVRIDCNRGRGTWKTSGPNQIEFGPLALTRAMCPPAPLNDRIPKDWEYVRSYTLKDGHLFLSLMADGGIYEFEPMAHAQPATGQVENTYWKLVHLGGTRVNAASPSQEPHLVLNSETHRVSGSGGCNRLMGSYQLAGDQLSFSQMVGTMMACAQGMDTERAFLNALGQVKAWRISGSTLELFDGAGKLLASFEARAMK